ncbi:hypothetical protein N7468_005090 [Penicillium chermesinum]|uniref:Uncharacterized protein n=1 Tax=Penicillium chermesinum TaxID=63820 RepID=A0A9W9TPC4_9EURO|nr:uncharacterized protein N7468_005090 [Penicillium chermesinum]KAJ5232134.1 hypothetical protein N7468_005090 [Penicillium chermesinum]
MFTPATNESNLNRRRRIQAAIRIGGVGAVEIKVSKFAATKCTAHGPPNTLKSFSHSPNRAFLKRRLSILV